MTTYLWRFKVVEKTYPVNVGEAERDKILAIQAKIKEQIGYEVTQRAVVTRAIQKLHKEIFEG
jgi:hypothetical protein